MTHSAALSVARRTTNRALVCLVAMEQTGVRRYVGLGTPSVLDARGKPTWHTRVPPFMARTFPRRAYDDLVGMTEVVRAADTDGTIVRYIAPKGRAGLRGHRGGELAVGTFRNGACMSPVLHAGRPTRIVFAW